MSRQKHFDGCVCPYCQKEKEKSRNIILAALERAIGVFTNPVRKVEEIVHPQSLSTMHSNQIYDQPTMIIHFNDLSLDAQTQVVRKVVDWIGFEPWHSKYDEVYSGVVVEMASCNLVLSVCDIGDTAKDMNYHKMEDWPNE